MRKDEEMTTPEKTAHQFAADGATDPAAPARARGAVDVAAPPEAVWDALASVENWPAFRDDVTTAATDGPAAPGRAFTWRASSLMVTSRFAIVERPTRLTWSNAAPGMTSSCVYEFHRTEDGRTRIRGEESMDASGIAPHIDDAFLEAGIGSWLDGIKAFVERERTWR
jgi:hypothetical protein